MYCTHCGSIIRSNSAYCFSCGKPVVIENDSNNQPNQEQPTLSQIPPIYFQSHLHQTQVPVSTNTYITKKSNAYITAIVFSYITLFLSILAFMLMILSTRMAYVYETYSDIYLLHDWETAVSALAFGCFSLVCGIMSISFGITQKNSSSFKHTSAFVFILSVFAFIIGILSMFA